MVRIEIAGGGFHDGRRFEVPTGMEAVLLFERDKDGNLNATFAVPRRDVDWQGLTEAMTRVTLELLGDANA